MKTKLGIICSSGASYVFRNLKFLEENNIELFFIFDRSCKAVEKCKKNKIEFKKLKFDKNFNKKSKKILKKKKIKNILTVFSRIVDENIYKNFSSYNIHPSFLPKYKGMGALKKQVENKEKFIGCTLHKINKKIDGGKIIFQIKNRYNLKNYKKVSFLQRVYLFMFYIKWLENKKVKKKNITYINNFFKKNIQNKRENKII